MKEEFISRLSTGGKLIVSGIQYKRRDEAVRGLKEAGLLLKNEISDRDWGGTLNREKTFPTRNSDRQFAALPLSTPTTSEKFTQPERGVTIIV